MMPFVDVLIVGAGPSGLTMACELAMHGIECRVIEKRVDKSRESRALGVQANPRDPGTLILFGCIVSRHGDEFPLMDRSQQ